MKKIRELANCFRFLTGLFCILMLISMWFSIRGFEGHDAPMAMVSGVLCAIMAGFCFGSYLGLNDQLREGSE